MTRSVALVGATVVSLIALGGCGSGQRVTTDARTVPSTASGNAPLLLAQFGHGVGAVPQGSAKPIWTDPNAVAALDGSAIFSIRRDGAVRLVRVEPRTGALMSSWPLRDGLSLDAVAPNGRWVALTRHTPGSAATEVVVFDPAQGSETQHLEFTGDLRPEAFSIDGRLLFALDYRGDHYRVQTIDFTTRQHFDTSDRDKIIQAEDMRGAPVHGVMSADRTLLATLYRNPDDAEEPAFVHVLDLEYGWSYCADLPEPFGTGRVGSDAIELTPRDTVIVATTHASRLAEIHIDEVHTPGSDPVTVEFRDGTITPRESALQSTRGFAHVIASIPT
jgi:hypothetical protein